MCTQLPKLTISRTRQNQWNDFALEIFIHTEFRMIFSLFFLEFSLNSNSMPSASGRIFKPLSNTSMYHKLPQSHFSNPKLARVFGVFGTADARISNYSTLSTLSAKRALQTAGRNTCRVRALWGRS